MPAASGIGQSGIGQSGIGIGIGIGKGEEKGEGMGWCQQDAGAKAIVCPAITMNA